jgi:hypothetical protein
MADAIESSAAETETEGVTPVQAFTNAAIAPPTDTSNCRQGRPQRSGYAATNSAVTAASSIDSAPSAK